GWHQDRYTGTNAGPSTKSMVDGLSPRSHIIFVSHEHSEEARMFYSTSRHSPRMGMVTFVLILTTLLTGCAWFSPNQPTPTLTRSPSPSSVASCHHLQPKLGPLRLAGLAYSPYHAGQSPDVGTFPSSAEVQADMATLKTVTNY